MKPHHLFYILFFVIFSYFSCTHQNKEKDNASYITKKEYIIPFALEHNKILIKGIFKDSTYTFILDNGCTGTCLSSTLFSHYYDTTKLRIVNPDWADPTCVVPIHIKFNNYDFSVDTIIAFDLSIYDTKREKSSDKGGIIGVKLFKDQIVEIDFEDSLLIIKNKLPENIKEYMSFDLLNLKDCQSKYDYDFKQIEISGFYDHTGKPFKGRFLVDLGCPDLTLNRRFNKHTDFNLSRRDTNSLAAYISRFHKISVDISGNCAKESKENITVDEAPLNIDNFTEQKFGDGFLGISFFSKFNVIFDYPHNKLYLKPNKYFIL